MFLVLEIIADSQPRLAKRLLDIQVITDNTENYIKINLILL